MDNNDSKYTAKNVNQRKNHLVNKTLSTFYVSNICNMLASVDQNVLTSNIYDLMEKDSLLPGLCITEDGQSLVGDGFPPIPRMMHYSYYMLLNGQAC